MRQRPSLRTSGSSLRPNERPETVPHYLPREVFFGRFDLPFPAVPSAVFGCDFAGFLLAIITPPRRFDQQLTLPARHHGGSALSACP